MTETHPIDFETLVAYWLGELPEAREAGLEEHLFACAHCSGCLEELAALAAGVHAVVRLGKLGMVVSQPFVQALKHAGLRLREYRLEPGESVHCTLGADDDAVVSHVRAPLAGVKRVDVVRLLAGGEAEERLADVPFDPATGEVVVIPSAAWLRTMPAFTMHMRLVNVGEVGESPLGEYTFRHSPG